jgi:hypothetical protein
MSFAISLCNVKIREMSIRLLLLYANLYHSSNHVNHQLKSLATYHITVAFNNENRFWLQSVLEVEKDKWGYGNLGVVDDQGAEGPEFEARVRSAEDRGAQPRGEWGMGRGFRSPLHRKICEKLYANLCISEHSGS